MSTHSHLEWHELKSELVLDGKIFQLVRSRRRSEDGRTGDYVLVDSPDWVNVIAVVQSSRGEDCFLMVRQYRQGGQCLTLEFPGGMVDDSEDLVIAAGRELSEETGYTAARLEHLGSTNPNPAFMTNTVHTYFAHGVTRNGGQSLDENELVDVELVPCAEVLAGRTPEFFAHGIMIIALHWYTQWRAQL
ncbi:MAG: NUDIX hydrolase [Spirochaetaceae bacterium]